jgi:c-di-GMP-binding flagellar brake protein YcgR
MKKAASTARPTASPAPRTRSTASAKARPLTSSLRRRREWRFFLPLTAIVEGSLPDGSKFREKARLENISSGGAFFQLASGIVVGSKFNLLIDMPKSATDGRKIQLKVGGKAIRLERPDKKSKKQGVAIRFGKDFGFVAGPKK